MLMEAITPKWDDFDRGPVMRSGGTVERCIRRGCRNALSDALLSSTNSFEYFNGKGIGYDQSPSTSLSASFLLARTCVSDCGVLVHGEG